MPNIIPPNPTSSPPPASDPRVDGNPGDGQTLPGDKPVAGVVPDDGHEIDAVSANNGDESEDDSAEDADAAIEEDADDEAEIAPVSK